MNRGRDELDAGEEQADGPHGEGASGPAPGTQRSSPTPQPHSAESRCADCDVHACRRLTNCVTVRRRTCGVRCRRKFPMPIFNVSVKLPSGFALKPLFHLAP